MTFSPQKIIERADDRATMFSDLQYCDDLFRQSFRGYNFATLHEVYDLLRIRP